MSTDKTVATDLRQGRRGIDAAYWTFSLGKRMAQSALIEPCSFISESRVNIIALALPPRSKLRGIMAKQPFGLQGSMYRTK
jgi:hypothetical protein